MIVLPEFCPDWYRVDGRAAAEQRAYIASELRRIDGEGAPLLTVCVAYLEDDRVRQIAHELLVRNHDAEGEAIYTPRAWRLKLVEGGKPPLVDPQGRQLPANEAGKVLVAKVGVLGGELDASADSREVMQWGAEKRDARARQGRDIYRYVRIGREPVEVSITDAFAILRQWGVGVAQRERRRPSAWRPGLIDDGTGQLNWLVEEISPNARAANKPTSKAA